MDARAEPLVGAPTRKIPTLNRFAQAPMKAGTGHDRKIRLYGSLIRRGSPLTSS
jgi:hypothetical protein